MQGQRFSPEVDGKRCQGTKQIFVTGDGPCPWCGKPIQGDKPETHHIHLIDEEGKRLDP